MFSITGTDTAPGSARTAECLNQPRVPSSVWLDYDLVASAAGAEITRLDEQLQ